MDYFQKIFCSDQPAPVHVASAPHGGLGATVEPAPPSAPYIDFDAQKAVTLNFLALRMGSSVFPTQGVNFDMKTWCSWGALTGAPALSFPQSHSYLFLPTVSLD